MTDPTSPSLPDRLRAIMRRDLKLPLDMPLPDDMPFFGGDADIDSLDVLLLVSSIEKEFAIKIPNEAVGRDAFKNVAALVRFIESRQAGTTAKGAVPAGTPGSVLDRLPHRDPFRFVSRVIHAVPGESAEAVWTLSGSEAFFAGHFPQNPIVPGVLIAEALAQVSGLTGHAPNPGTKPGGMLVQVDMRFERPVSPPAEIILRSKILRELNGLRQCEVVALHAGETVARGTLALRVW